MLALIWLDGHAQRRFCSFSFLEGDTFSTEKTHSRSPLHEATFWLRPITDPENHPVSIFTFETKRIAARSEKMGKLSKEIFGDASPLVVFHLRYKMRIRRNSADNSKHQKSKPKLFHRSRCLLTCALERRRRFWIQSVLEVYLKSFWESKDSHITNGLYYQRPCQVLACVDNRHDEHFKYLSVVTGK